MPKSGSRATWSCTEWTVRGPADELLVYDGRGQWLHSPGMWWQTSNSIVHHSPKQYLRYKLGIWSLWTYRRMPVLDALNWMLITRLFLSILTDFIGDHSAMCWNQILLHSHAAQQLRMKEELEMVFPTETSEGMERRQERSQMQIISGLSTLAMTGSLTMWQASCQGVLQELERLFHVRALMWKPFWLTDKEVKFVDTYQP